MLDNARRKLLALTFPALTPNASLAADEMTDSKEERTVANVSRPARPRSGMPLDTEWAQLRDWLREDRGSTEP